jgi:hypothetical protein
MCATLSLGSIAGRAVPIPTVAASAATGFAAVAGDDLETETHAGEFGASRGQRRARLVVELERGHQRAVAREHGAGLPPAA